MKRKAATERAEIPRRVRYVGLTLMIANRLKDDPKTGQGAYFDWMFLVNLYLLAISGFLSWILRLVDLPIVAYPVYFFHLMVVFVLLIFLPYTKFAHLIYRTLAMTWAIEAGLDVTPASAPAPPAPAPPAEPSAEAKPEAEGEQG